MLAVSPQPTSEPVLHTKPIRPAPELKLSRKSQAAWRRAVDELLIDAIFGPGLESLCAARPMPPRVRSASR